MVAFRGLHGDENVIEFCGRWLWCASDRTLSQLMITGGTRLLRPTGSCGRTTAASVCRLSIEN